MKLYLTALVLFFAAVLSACGGGGKPENNSNTATQNPQAAAPSPTNKSLPKIVAFGDSLTAGLGLTAAESYPSILQKKLELDGYQYEVVNAGVSGDTSAGGLQRIDWALEGDVRFMILELGANDLLRGLPVREMKNNLDKIIERAQRSGAVVLLAGMYAPTNAGAEYQREVGEAFQSLARERKVTLIPFFLDRVAGVESLNQQDGIHPNAEGTRIVAETVYAALRPLLDKEKQAGAGAK
ncbi:MAG TPA: arylesterase [Pyrinomonadaceae bacterium]|jgi:acyl-CoA thioesterase-1